MAEDPTFLATPDVGEQPPTGFRRWSEIGVAIALIILGIIILIETRDIRVVRSMAKVSPRAIPNIVGGGLIVIGLWYAWDIWRNPNGASGGEDDEDADPNAPVDWVVLGALGIGLIAFAATVQPLGWVLASALLFTIAAIAMGKRQPRDVVFTIGIGILMGIAIFLVFDTWLGVRLPEGVLSGVLPT